MATENQVQAQTAAAKEGFGWQFIEKNCGASQEEAKAIMKGDDWASAGVTNGQIRILNADGAEFKNPRVREPRDILDKLVKVQSPLYLVIPNSQSEEALRRSLGSKLVVASPFPLQTLATDCLRVLSRNDPLAPAYRLELSQDEQTVTLKLDDKMPQAIFSVKNNIAVLRKYTELITKFSAAKEDPEDPVLAHIAFIWANGASSWPGWDGVFNSLILQWTGHQDAALAEQNWDCEESINHVMEPQHLSALKHAWAAVEGHGNMIEMDRSRVAAYHAAAVGLGLVSAGA